MKSSEYERYERAMRSKTQSAALRARLGRELSEIQSLVNREFNKYMVFYTHNWTQGNGAGNILVLPSDKRFDESEFIGMVIDMVMDYYENMHGDTKGSLGMKMLGRSFTKLSELGIEGFKEEYGKAIGEKRGGNE